jgi:hypothetical protein
MFFPFKVLLKAMTAIQVVPLQRAQIFLYRLPVDCTIMK